jgi:hypothetical protein
MKPNTKIKMKGNTKLNTIADGLLLIARRLAIVIAHIALSWLYFILVSVVQNYGKGDSSRKSIISMLVLNI